MWAWLIVRDHSNCQIAEKLALVESMTERCVAEILSTINIH